jgi:lipid II:glycine glycyltransferase (peptidoglycan interpeptide bridge formation enzyme)
MDIIHINNNVIVNLFQEDIWHQSYEYSTRKNINKAIRSGLKQIVMSGSDISDEWIRIFHDIYSHTMQRNQADDFYFFDIDLFRELAFELPENIMFFFILNNKSEPISTELVSYNEFAGYSLLGGTLSEFYQYRPNDLIKHTIIENLRLKGLRYFCLGGGIVPDDGIFRFKKTFSKDGVVNFYIGKKIHNEEIYGRILSLWELKNPQKKEKYKHYLLKYKY